MADRAESLSARAGAATAFLDPELLALPEETLEQAAADPEMADYDRYLRELLRQRPHTLSPAEEKLLAMASEATGTASNAYDMLVDADMRFPQIEGEDGQQVRLTQAGYIPLMMSRDREVRRRTFEAYYDTYGSFSSTIPALYAGSVKGDLFYAKAARFASALEASLFGDNVPVQVYENLIAETRAHIPSLARYLNARRRLLGLDSLEMYDLYVPVDAGFDLKMPFEEACGLVEEALAVLGGDYRALLRKARTERWIDPFENGGKSSGAYSWGTYDSHPYVLMNYHENLDSVSTIAHELGHAMHSWYSNAAQPYPKSGYSLFVAEVASTVNEVLLALYLLDRYPQREAQIYLLGHLLENFRTTLFRQVEFAEFEKRAHEMAENGEALTGESLNALYGGLNRAYYPQIRQDERIDREWMRIPHFYRAFYVYQYATGFSAATAIARALREEGPEALKRYKAFLSSGGSADPIDELRIAGVDMASGEAVASALRLFDELTERYERFCEIP
ncbi:MAG: oligoendopeptidase F [Clostridia bacterium]|nr:oligoendopeptidase F [Clostridia bacterium]